MNTIQLTTIFLLLLDLAIPIILVFVCIVPFAHSRLDWAFRATLALGYFGSLFVIIPVCFLGFFCRMLMGLIVVAGIVYGYAHITPGTVGGWRFASSILCATLGLGLAGITVRTIVVGYGCPEDHLDLRSPFRDGTWCVLNGGGSLWINSHNVPNQIYGMDIMKVNSMGKVVNGFLPISDKLQDFATFGADLCSPCDGVILYVDDGNEDLPPGQLPPRNTAGNLILLGHGRFKILMGHLKKGSLRVREGDAVSQGQLIAQCGNSGHATFPHLHISFATGGPYKAPYSGIGVAARFDGRFLVRNSFLSGAAGN